jgi:hypothetical protein
VLEQKHIRHLIFLLILLLGGCSSVPLRKNSKTPEISPLLLEYAQYKKFVIENLKALDQIYSDSYEQCEYLVKTNDGIQAVQMLIDLEAARLLLKDLKIDKLSQHELVAACLNYIFDNFEYSLSPDIWPDVALTIKMKRGDCKGLSLLLISMLQLLGIECYGAVNSGHMWVRAFVDGHWVILETDSDKKRNFVYQLKGFYDKPVFRIYHNRTEKRIRKQKLTKCTE